MITVKLPRSPVIRKENDMNDDLKTYREAMGDKAKDFEKVFGPYNHAELQTAFDAVKNPDDWRDKVDAWVEMEKVPVTKAAIAYFTSTEAKEEEARTQHRGIEKGVEVRLTSCGYRMGPAGP